MINLSLYYTNYMLYGFGYYFLSEIFFKTQYRFRKHSWELIGHFMLFKDAVIVLLLFPELSKLDKWIDKCHPLEPYLQTQLSAQAAWYLYKHWYQFMNYDEKYGVTEVAISVCMVLCILVCYENCMSPVWLIAFITMTSSTCLFNMVKTLESVLPRNHQIIKNLYVMYAFLYVVTNVFMFPNVVMKHTIVNWLYTGSDAYYYWFLNVLLLCLHLIKVVEIKHIVCKLLTT